MLTDGEYRPHRQASEILSVRLRRRGARQEPGPRLHTLRDAGGADIGLAMAVAEGRHPRPAPVPFRTDSVADRRPRRFPRAGRSRLRLRRAASRRRLFGARGRPGCGAPRRARGAAPRRPPDQDRRIGRGRQPLRSAGADAVHQCRDRDRGRGMRASRRLCDGALPSDQRDPPPAPSSACARSSTRP